MRKAILVAAIALTACFTPARADAWGFAGHRLIMARALDLLPAELQPFFQKFRDEVVIRAVDPDLWRNAGWDDDPNHFVDFGMPELGPYPFAALPRERDRALEKFGARVMNRVGYLPWREAEMFGSLRRAFEGFRGGAAYATTDVVLFAPVASHYIQDAHQPFHASDNYDGQLTGNSGIHARFERDLVERFESRLTLSPASPRPVTNPRDFAFDALLASHQLVDAILKADSAAVAGKEAYDDDYYEKFFSAVKPTLEKQLSQAITATASIIIGAWQAADKPALALSEARPLQRVRKPQ
jgi:hypothetical protein